VKELLADPGRRARLARSGLAAVNRAHRDIHRARALSRLLRALPASQVAARRAQARMLRRAWLRPLYLLLAESLDNAALRTAYLRAATAGKNSHASIHQGDCDA
jgi:hypothetical protein